MKKLLNLALSLLMAAVILIPVNAKTVYKVTINLGEGTFEDGKHTKVFAVEEGATLGDSIIQHTDPAGYTTVGYALGDEKEVCFNGEELYYLKPRKDMVVTAIYAKAYTVTLDYNGSPRELSAEHPVIAGQRNFLSHSMPEAPKPGEALAGWSTKKTGEPEYTIEDLENYAYTKDMTFYAIYKPAVTITLDGNGGVFYPDETTTAALVVPKGYKYYGYGEIPDKDDCVFEGWATKKNGEIVYGAEDDVLSGAVFDKDTTLYAVYRKKIFHTSVKISKILTMYVGETVAWPIDIQPANADYAIIGTSHDASVARPVMGGIEAFREGVAEIEYMFQSEKEFFMQTLTVTVVPKEQPETREFGFVEAEGKKYWYEDWKKQGVYGDPKNIWDDGFGGLERGREIYDPESDGWYWLDACYDGAAAFGKEVWMPYVYQDEDKWEDGEIRMNADNADEGLKEYAYQCMKNKTGKWVRYDNDGKMLKGWVAIEGDLAKAYPKQVGNTYYYDHFTGLMAKGEVIIEGKKYFFDKETGVLQK